MKILLSCVIALNFNNIFAQGWMQQQSNTTETLRKVHFVDANHGCAVGLNGIILTTIDGGINWVVRNGGTLDTLYDVHFINLLKGFIVSNNTLYVTSDGGVNWSSLQDLAPGTGEAHLHFIDVDTGFVAKSGSILMTFDGGASWREKPGPNIDLGLFWATDTLNFYCGGQDGILIESHDSGASWNLTTPLNSSSFYEDVFFTSNGTSHYVGWNIAFGSPWPLYTRRPNSATFNANSFAIYGVYFTSDSDGYLVGSGGTIYKSLDEGSVWSTQSSGVVTSLFGIDFVDDFTGFIVGENGTILKTTTAGEVGLEALQHDGFPWSLYPNPAVSTLTIEAENLHENSTIEIGDFMGRIVKTIRVMESTNRLEIDIRDLSGGAYQLKIKKPDAVTARVFYKP